MIPYNHFDVEKVEDVTLIRLDVTLIRLNGLRFGQRLMIDGLRSALVRLLANENPSRLLVSCRQVHRMTSESTEALLRVKRELRASDGALKLCGLRPRVLEVFQLLKLCGRVFQIFEDEKKAVKEFTSASIGRATD